MASSEADIVRLSVGPEDTSGLAKEYTLDIPRIPSVEFPLCISKDQRSVNKAVEMCGGIGVIKRALNERGESLDSQQGLELYLNQGKDDSGCESYFNEHPIVGKRVPFRDESIILKIQMPQGTLEKHGNNVQKALASLNSRDVRVSPVAIVDNTIKFREMSDFQIRLENGPCANEFKYSFGSLDWNNFKKFVSSVPDNDTRPFENIGKLALDRNTIVPSSDFQLPPPPRLSMVSLPLLYKYKTNPFATKRSNGVAEVKGTYIKNYQQFIHEMGDDVKIPMSPHELLAKDYAVAKETGIWPGTKKESKFYDSLEKCIEVLNELFSRRPIWIKRHIDGIVDKSVHHTLKIALALVSYRFTMGPWRNTYIKFGLDPRSSSEYAKYQTEYFKIERKLMRSPAVNKNIPSPPPSVFVSDTHGGIDSRFKFNGSQIPWYLMLQIDLLTEEPNIKEIFDKIEYLPNVNELTGWFEELDLAKIRKIVKYELGCMVQGNFKFNEYKLKYFKTMLYVKESMMKEQGKDADGDIQMGSNEYDKGLLKSPNAEEGDEDDDNGVATGEVDEVALEAEEVEDDANVRVELHAEDEEEEDNQGDFDAKSASFQEIIDQVARTDVHGAQLLQKELSGFVNQSRL